MQAPSSTTAYSLLPAFALGGALALAPIAAASLAGAFHTPAPVEPAPLHCAPDTPSAQVNAPLRVLVWNIQYGASTKHHFFYDGGEAVRVPASDVDWTLDQIVQVVSELDPDIVLWQEIDRNSARTGYVDQLPILVERLGHPCFASATYHRVPYVPTPDHEHLGRVDMQLAVSGKVRLDQARRHQLAMLVEPWWRRMFNLKRAALEVRAPVEGGAPLTLINTHLSAFSRGDGTLPRQLAEIEAIAHQARDRGEAVLLAGDLNSLSPGDDPSRLPEEDRELYSDPDEPLGRLYASLTPTVSLEAIRRDPARYYTYVPFGGRPDRMIDHAFVAGPVRASGHRVWQERTDISDHLPFTFTLVVPPR